MSHTTPRVSLVLVAAFAVATIAPVAGGQAGASGSVVHCAGLPASIVGSPGPDRIVGKSRRDVIHAGDGNDSILGLDGHDVLCGGKGDDLLVGGSGGDLMFGGPGNDVLRPGPGHDTVDGGPGDDSASFSSSPYPITASIGSGTARGWGNDSLTAIEALVGSDYDDKLSGGPRDDLVTGGPGNDVIKGGGGDDHLVGGSGDDQIRGGPGADAIADRNDDDTLLGGYGDDTISGGSGRDVLKGGPGDDKVRGGSGGDVVGGQTGADIVAGGPGRDVVEGGPGADRARGGGGDDLCAGTHLRTSCERRPTLIRPAPGAVEHAFGPRLHPILGIVRMHNGWDIDADCGEPLHAAAAGVVDRAGFSQNGGGNAVFIDHGDGLTSVYAHLQAIGVGEGQVVDAGQVIGLTGMTGLATACHLHLEIRVDDQPVDPTPYLCPFIAPRHALPPIDVCGDGG